MTRLTDEEVERIEAQAGGTSGMFEWRKAHPNQRPLTIQINETVYYRLSDGSYDSDVDLLKAELGIA